MNKFNLGKQENAFEVRDKKTFQTGRQYMTAVHFNFHFWYISITNLKFGNEPRKREKNTKNQVQADCGCYLKNLCLCLVLYEKVQYWTFFFQINTLNQQMDTSKWTPANGHVKPNSRQYDHKAWNSSQMKLSAFNLYHKFFTCNGTSDPPELY